MCFWFFPPEMGTDFFRLVFLLHSGGIIVPDYVYSYTSQNEPRRLEYSVTVIVSQCQAVLVK